MVEMAVNSNDWGEIYCVSSQEIKTSQLFHALDQNIYASKYSVHIDVESL